MSSAGGAKAMQAGHLTNMVTQFVDMVEDLIKSGRPVSQIKEFDKIG
jgi:hypothetical protein